MATSLKDGPGTIRLSMVDDVLHVAALDAKGQTLVEFAGGDTLDMIREAIAVLDPQLGMSLGADPEAIVQRLLGDD